MTATRALLLFLSDGIAPPQGWLRLADGVVVARGGEDTVPPIPEDGGEEPEAIILVVPGTDVAIHWIELPSLAPAQALAAAKLMVADVAAEPADRLHVALGPPDDDGARAMALVSSARMALWLAQAQALGLDPDSVIPETLLLSPPPEGARVWARGPVSVVRAPGVALAAEPDLARLAVPGEPVAIDDAAFEAGLADALATLPVDLRQGAFARKRQWKFDWSLARRLAKIAAGILVATLLIQIVLIVRYNLDAERLEREITGIARTALPRAANLPNPEAQLAERLAALRGGGLGFSATVGGLFTAVRDAANVELEAVQFDADGAARATVQAASAADIAAFQQRLQAQGFAVEGGDIRAGGGRQMAEITVRAR